MGALELKSDLLEMMGNIEDERLLQSLYDFLKSREVGKTSNLWDKLTLNEKDRVLLSYEESENEENFIPYKSVLK